MSRYSPALAEQIRAAILYARPHTLTSSQRAAPVQLQSTALQSGKPCYPFRRVVVGRAMTAPLLHVRLPKYFIVLHAISFHSIAFRRDRTCECKCEPADNIKRDFQFQPKARIACILLELCELQSLDDHTGKAERQSESQRHSTHRRSQSG